MIRIIGKCKGEPPFPILKGLWLFQDDELL
jgi:hypothetical protein